MEKIVLFLRVFYKKVAVILFMSAMYTRIYGGCEEPFITQIKGPLLEVSAQLNGFVYTTWQVRIRKQGEANWNVLELVPVFPNDDNYNWYSVTHLMDRGPNVYEVQCRFQCWLTSGWSNWSNTTRVQNECLTYDDPSSPGPWVSRITRSATSLKFLFAGNAPGYTLRLHELSANGNAHFIGDFYDNGFNEIEINGLKSNTDYTYYYSVRCNDRRYPVAAGDINWAHNTSTLCAPPPLSEIDFYIENNGTAVDVYCISQAVKWQFRLRPRGGSNWTTSPEKTTNHHLFSNLVKDQNYDIQIRIVCEYGSLGQINWTDWSSSYNFIIPGTCSQPVIGIDDVRNITTNSARLVCQSGHTDGNVTKHHWRYRKNDGANWTEVTSNGNDVTIQFQEKMESILYVYQVQHECGNGITGNWSVQRTFTSKANCDVPTVNDIEINEINFTSAKLKSFLGGSAFTWKYRKKSGGGVTTTPETTTKSLKIENLNAGTEYEVALKRLCDGVYTDYSAWKSFTTDACILPPYLLNAEDITNTTVTLAMYSPDDFDLEWQYKQTSNANWRKIKGGLYLSIDSLIANTQYEYRARIICNEAKSVYSDWSTIYQFKTTCASFIKNFSNVTTNSITVNAADKNASSYQYRMKISGNASWTTSNSTSALSYTFNNLIPATYYEFQVGSTCNTTTTWSASAFEYTDTARACTAPRANQLFVNNISDRSAEVSCSKSNVINYQYRITLGSDTSIWVTTRLSSTGIITLTPLMPSTRYQIQCRVVCQGNEVSDWSASKFFMTSAASLAARGACISPRKWELVPRDIDKNSVTLSCISQSSLYQFRYKDTAASIWKVLAADDTNKVFINSLKENTTYEFQCRIYCNGDFGNYSDSRLFTTAAPNVCDEPSLSEYIAFNIGTDDATIVCLTKAEKYVVRYKAYGTRVWQIADTSAESEINLNHLQSNTKYVYQISLVCTTSQQSVFSSIKEFTTKSLCSGIDSRQLKAEFLAQNKVILKLDSSNFFFYEFRFRPAGDSTWTVYSNSVAEVYLENLLVGKRYEYQVRVYCGSQSNSDWSNSAFFTTSSTTAIKNENKVKSILFPVPAKNQLVLKLEENSIPLTHYEVLDATGKVSMHGKIFQSYTSWDVSQWPDGIYFIRIYSRLGSEVKKCIVQK